MFTAPETDEIVQPAWQPPETDEILRGNIPLDTPDQMTRALRNQGPSGMTPPSMAPTDEGLREIVNNPGQLPAFVMGAAMIPGKVAYQAAADVVALADPIGRQYGGNLLYGDRQPWQAAPVDVFLDDLARTNPNLAVAGKVTRSLAEMSPLSVVGMLPTTLQRLVAAGFTLDMVAHAPSQFEAFADEYYKPREDQDPAKLSTLWSDVIQTGVFTPLAGTHAANPRGARVAIGPVEAMPWARNLPPALLKPIMQLAKENLTVQTPVKPTARYVPARLAPEREAQRLPSRAKRLVQPSADLAAALEIRPQQYIGTGNPPAGQYRVTDEMTREQVTAAEAKALQEIKDALPQLSWEELTDLQRGRGLPERFNQPESKPQAEAVPAWEAGDMIVRSAEPSAPRPSPLAPPKELPPPPETTPAPSQVAPPRAAEPIQAASARGAGENAAPKTSNIQHPTSKAPEAKPWEAKDEVVQPASTPLTAAQASEFRSLERAMRDAQQKGDGERYDRLKDRWDELSAQVKAKPVEPPAAQPAAPALPKSQGHVAFVQHEPFTGMPVEPVEFYIKGRNLYRADTRQAFRGGQRKSGYSVELKNGKIKETGQTVEEYIQAWTDYMNKSAAQSRGQMTQFAKAAEERAAAARKPVEPPAAAEAKMQEHVTDVAQGNAGVPKADVRDTKSKAPVSGPRPAREVKTELVQRLEEIAKNIPEPQFKESKVITKGGKRTFNYSLGEVIVEVSEAARSGDGWVARTSEISGKTGARTEKIVGQLPGYGDITKAKEWAGGVLEKLVYPERSKPVTIEIPGDGTFTIEQTHYAINRTLDRARKLNTSSGGKGYTEPARPNFNQAEWFRQARGDVKSKAPRTGRGRVASPPALGGGDLGAGPRPPGEKPPIVDDPRHSVFDAMPMEMPEAVQMVKQLTGVFPEIRENLGDAAGVFTFTQGPAGKGKVSLLAKIFDLLDANDKARIKQEALNYAEAANPVAPPAQKARLANERYQFLLREAYDAAKLENPKQAMKTMWHEIGHVVDWLPDRIIRGRGNLFARLASLKGYFKHVLPLDPKRVGPFQEKPTPGELTKLRKEAYAAAQAEIGPMREILETIMVEEPIYREAGITAEMVKRLFGMDARETMPELYRWFAEQSPAVKKEIVRSAMKGMVDERLKNAPAAGREQIGTRKIEREVRRREGRPPTPQEVEAKFKQMFRAELERRNIAELATVKKELEGLIAWWRGTERMPDYFKTSWEMYADAFSVFANNPAALESRAPTYAKLIWNYLDRKPEVKALYDQIQGDIKNGAVMPKRIQTLHEMWGRADAQSLDLAKSAGKLTGKDVLDNVQYHVDRRFGPIYRAAQGTRFQGRIADAVGNFLYRMSEHERYLASLNEQVGKLLVKHNLDWTNDLGEYLFHRRIIHERFNLANPLGWTSKNSIERLAELRTTLGPERWAALEEAGNRYRAEYERFVVAELESAKMFNPELQAAIAERAHYATFAALKGMPDEGIAKILETRFGSSVTPHIYSQLGHLGEIKNPATATVLKGLSLISSAYRNTMKKEVVRMLGELHPEDIMPAKTRWSGKGIEPIIVDNNPAVGTVVYLDQGKVQAFYVRRVVSDAVNSATGGDNLAYSLLLNATGWQKGLFTQLNYGFWPFNFVKDTLGWWFQMPGVTAPYYWAKNLPKAIVAARQSVTHSKPNPWADAALRRKMLISKGDPRGVWAAAENEFEVKLASFGMDPAQWKGQGDAVHRLVKAWDYYKNLGQTFERVNKINGMLYLDEKFASMPEWKKREIVRERGGSPNFLERGAANPMIDLVALFYNPWKESLRSVAKSAQENPWSFATKATTAVLMPTILQAAAVNGWLGPDRKEQYDSIPDFDLTNYLVVPLGWVDRDARKVMYLRLPLWEPARVAHGLLFQSLTPRGKGLGAHAGGQLPGLNPMWKIGLAWASYLQGNNPVDTTRGVAVMPDKVFAAGGPATLAEMAKYSWNEMGGSVVYRFKNLNLESAPESEGEKFLAMPGVNNALGRWLKVSDRGLADQQRSLAGETQQARAEVQLGVDEILRRLTGEGSWDNLLQSLKSGDQAAMQRAVQAAQLTDAEKMLMRDPYALQYFTRKFPELVLSKASPDARMWFNAQSNEERAKLLQKGLIQPKPIR